jgi:hypothetical protein
MGVKSQNKVQNNFMFKGYNSTLVVFVIYLFFFFFFPPWLVIIRILIGILNT